MPTLSIIKVGNKCAITYLGTENEIIQMLTQCALRDELLAETILQSAQHINQNRTESQMQENAAQLPIEMEIFQVSYNANGTSVQPEISES